MRIPEIENIGVQSRTEAPQIVGAAQRQAIEVFAQGFEAIGKAMVASQQQKADASLAVKLNGIEQDIAARKTISTTDLKEKLGGSLDALPPEIRSQVTLQGVDLNTGEEYEQDREDIPMHVVAGAIFDAQARRALSDSSQAVTLGGWRADFEERAQERINERKARVGMQAVRESVAYLQVEDTSTALDFANAGDFAHARKAIDDSKAMDADYKVKLHAQIDKLEQIRPVYEALQRDDYAEMSVLLGKLNDPKEFTKLDSQERAQFTDRLKAEVRQFQEAAKKEKDRLLKAEAEKGWNGIFAKVRSGVPISYKDIPPPGMISADEQKAMIEYVDNKKKGIEPKTDLGLYAYLTNMARTSPEEFADLDITALVNRLSPSDFKHFIDLQTKPASGPQFDDFLNTDEAIEAKLPAQLKAAKVKGNESGLAKAGHIKQIVQHELAGLGHRASLTERDDIIDKVIKDNIKIEEGYFSDDAVVETLGIPPKYVVSIRKVAARLGAGTKAPDIKRVYDDFQPYEDTIVTAWSADGRSRGKRISPDKAFEVYGYMKANIAAIDAELARQGKLTGKPEIDNPLRAALAVDSYLSNP